jgi:exodeoxyribonuclease VII large subunit
MSESLPTLSVSDFVAALNQTLEVAYGEVIVEGEISSFRVAKARYVYFDLKDEDSSVNCFMTVYQLRVPLEDGMRVRIYAAARLTAWGRFSLVVRAVEPAGEGAIKKAFELLRAKLAAEGLFAPERKRPLPAVPESVGLITAAGSAAAADFVKIIGSRWGGLTVTLADVFVQGVDAPAQLVAAIEHFNQMAEPPEVLVVVRGGGSADDLAAFSTEPVVRAVAGSRIPTLVAIGHETDLSLAELAADLSASTPSNAAELLVPDKKEILTRLGSMRQQIGEWLTSGLELKRAELKQMKQEIVQSMNSLINSAGRELTLKKTLLAALNPKNVLQRGYAIIRLGGKAVASINKLKVGARAEIEMQAGTASASITSIDMAN